MFSSGSVITIEGNVKDEALYNGKVRITNEANAMIKEQVYKIHGLTTYNFNITHLVSVTVASVYTITVEFQVHGLNNTTKAVRVNVRP